MSDILITDSGSQISDGTIVVLARFPGTRWIVHHGWYTYQGNQCMGWYFSSIPSQTILPLTSDELVGVQIISTSDGCCYPNVPCPPPSSDCGGDTEFTHEMKHELERAWITVDTMEQLSRLNRRLVPNGKIVRVNDSGSGSANYYRYNQATQSWEIEHFGIDTNQFVTKDSMKDEVKSEVESQLGSIDISTNVANVIQTNQSVKDTITDITKLNWKTLE